MTAFVAALLVALGAQYQQKGSLKEVGELVPPEKRVGFTLPRATDLLGVNAATAARRPFTMPPLATLVSMKADPASGSADSPPHPTSLPASTPPPAPSDVPVSTGVWLPESTVKIQPPAEVENTNPWILRWMLKDVPRGMLVRLPIIDTDPNRGSTIGMMPIWVLKEKNGDRIEEIHAPSITYNKIFKAIPTYRYYNYPTDNSSIILRAAASLQEERELLARFESEDFLGKDYKAYGKVQYNVDGAKRFFGFGPDSPKLGEANYIEDTIQYEVSFGAPLRKDSPWKAHAYNNLAGLRMKNGRTPNLPSFRHKFPGMGPIHRQQTNLLGARIDYDTRDHGITTSKGAYFNMYSETSIRGFASAFDFQRYGMDARWFRKPSEDAKHADAVQFKYDQQLANAPFWLMPNVGGKSSLRAYGDGRYVDRGSMVVNFEHRYTLWAVKLAGVTTEFELDPFVGMGTAFDNPGRLSRRYVRPLAGLAIRAVARPQVVGSIDFGYGQEGMAAFIDINYSF